MGSAMRGRKEAAPPVIGAAIGAALPLLRKISSFPAVYTSLAALCAALLTLTTTISALPAFVALPAISHPCSNSAPLLSVDTFAFGCQKSTTSDAATFFLAVFFRSVPSGPAVWIANPTRPVSRNASLLLSSSAHLILSDPDTSPAWSFAFSASSPPAGITLIASGNLIILDSANSPLWQSFLHPLDLLLPGQIMTPGMKLISGSHSPSTINGREIITYSAVMEPAGIAFFANFTDSRSLPYSIFNLNSNSGHLDDAMNDRDYCSGGVDNSGHSAELQFSYDATQLFLRSCVANVSVNSSITFGMDHQTVDFLRLDPDGNMRGYKYDYGNATWNVVYDWFVNNSNINYGICNLPSVCGSYGICNHLAKNECSCPHLSSTRNSDQQLFLPLNKSDLRQGCRLAHPLDCSANEASYNFIKLQGADYFANDALSNEHMSRSTEQECLDSCAQNCTCKAAFYRADIRACFQYEQVVSIIGLANDTKIFDSTQISVKMKKKASYVTQILAGGSAPLTAQLVQNSAQSNSTQMGNRSSSNVLSNYVGFLKVKNNSVQGTSSSTGPSSSKPGKKRYLIIFIGSTVAGLFLIGVTIGLFCVCCKKRRRFKALKDEEFYTSSTLPGIVHFTFAQLQEASGDFKCKLGVGGFGSVYKGTLSNGSIVAIKQLENAIRGNKEFESQVDFLHSLNHPNIVRLSGFCSNGSRRLLISDYMFHGSLDAWIFNKPINKLEDRIRLSSSSTHASSLDWKTRFSIALDVAKGLAFLHENNLVHLDIKPQNILLDEGFVAKLSDYGLSRLMDQEEGCLIMHMRGATGYMAPEWLQHACATEKSDVYSYGMVLMEMLGGRKNVDLSKERESWFFPLLAAKMYKEGKVVEVLDENLTKSTMNAMGEAECEQAKRVMQIAFWCILESPTKRPDMGNLLSMLQGHQEVPEPPLPVSFGGLNVHASMSNLDDSHHFHHNYYDQSGASSPSCFNISLASEPSFAMAAYNSWSSGGGHQDDCSLLLPSQN